MSGVVTKVRVTISDHNWSHRRRDPVAKKTNLICQKFKATIKMNKQIVTRWFIILYSKRDRFSVYTDHCFLFLFFILIFRFCF